MEVGNPYVGIISGLRMIREQSQNIFRCPKFDHENVEVKRDCIGFPEGFVPKANIVYLSVTESR
jgi:hypothetical protein